MTEPSDRFEEWLAGHRIEPLSPRPGGFDRIARSARRRRWARAGGTGAVVLLVVAGVIALVSGIPGPVTGPGIAPSTTAPSTTAVSPSNVPTSSSAPVVVGPTSPSAGPGGGRCATGQLRVTVAPGDSAAGHLGLRVVFTNTGSGSCTMFGYPGVSFVTGASGAQVNDPAQRAGGPSVLVAVVSGGSAHADLLLTQVGNYPVGVCKPVSVAGLRVYPPDETGAVFVGSVQQVCSVRGTGVAQIYPVQSGP